MPPKPRPVRKVSSTTPKDAPGAHAPPKDTTNPSTSMPPPPDPVPPLGILEGEATALSACLQVRVQCNYALVTHRLSMSRAECGGQDRPDLLLLR